ncbi:MAG TPA: ABC transporter permease, partial [Agromyces sp.]
MSTRVSTPAGAGAGERTEPGFIDNVALIAGREITMRFRSKAFLWSTAVLMLAVLASVVLGGIFGAQDSTPKVAVVAGASAVVDGNESLAPVAATDQDDAERML